MVCDNADVDLLHSCWSLRRVGMTFKLYKNKGMRCISTTFYYFSLPRGLSYNEIHKQR